jgi:hypothetical protein
MLVKSQCIGNRVTGLVVGKNNVRRYFPRKVEAINLKLDHLLIECGLAARFWDGEPEIRDPRLCLWLESKQSRESNCRASMPLYMTPTGEGAFSLGFPEPHRQTRANRRTSTASVNAALRHEPRIEVRIPDLDLDFELQNLETGAAA